jgi:outer membrane protein OmpA-like peptidoglycan-associated protein
MGSAPQRSQDSSDTGSLMADTPKSRPANEPEEESVSNSSASYEELRHLILAPEQEVLGRLHERIDNPESRTEDVSDVVAEAIQLRRKQGGSDALSDALSPTIETALRESVRKDPTTLADALFPVMGPAIRRSILETLRSFLDSFNQILDQSLSWQGLKWRVEALRTGRSFTEVALLHSLVFRVEQVFLIHKKNGLPIGHAVAPSVAMQDPSLVSGMLSAIQDFVRDSFDTAKGQGVNRMSVGDLDVWVEIGPYAILAAVIRGVAPRTVHNRMQETLEKIHAEYSKELERFNGDTAPFVNVHKELSECLEAKFKEESKETKSYGYVLAAAGVLLALLGGWLGWRWWQYHKWSELTDTLGNQPGLTVTSFAHEHGKFVIRGLRDPLAPDPNKFVTDAGLDPAKAEFHWGSYYALDDSLVQQRAIAALQPPAAVSLTVKDGVLRVEGKPSAKWLSDVRSRGVLIPGIQSLDLGRFSPEQIAFNEARARIQAVIIRFPVASSELNAEERGNLKNILPLLKELQNAPVAHSAVNIEVIGHSDTTGAETLNQNLSQRRADRIAAQLAQLGIPVAILHTKGVATAEPVRPEDTEENRQYNRSATFRVVVPSAGQP